GPAGVRRTIVTLLAVGVALTVPATAWAHAALLRTVPSASGILNGPPASVQLSYSEAVEPRFAIVSVTDVNAKQVTSGPPARSPANADTLVVPLEHLPEGWYLVYWRVISVDGHPVRGAYTFAVGPNAGPAPQFVIPSISETAATPKLIAARWIVFLSFMSAVGLLALRLAIARPVVRRVSGTNLRPLSIAFFVTSAVGLLAAPVYLLLATAGLALALDWLHLAAGAIWIGGLIGLLVLWRSLSVATRVAGLVVAVPRFSNVALGSVIVLTASGTWASILHLPTVGSLWQTSYGQ